MITVRPQQPQAPILILYFQVFTCTLIARQGNKETRQDYLARKCPRPRPNVSNSGTICMDHRWVLCQCTRKLEIPLVLAFGRCLETKEMNGLLLKYLCGALFDLSRFHSRGLLVVQIKGILPSMISE